MNELSKYGIEVLKLPSGLTIFLKRMKVEMACISLFVKCGAFYENKKNSGISHLIEHLTGEDGLIKERRRRPVYRIERLGGELDCETSQELIEYHLQTWLHCWRRSFGLLFDMVANLRFSEANLAQEKQVIINEQINEKNEFDDAVGRILFPNHPMRLPAAGTRAVSSITSRQIRRWHRRFFQPKRIIVIVVGAMSMKQLVGLIERSELNNLDNDEIIEEPSPIEIKWHQEHIISELDKNQTALIYSLDRKSADRVFFDYILEAVADISTLGVCWDILRPLGLYEGLSMGAYSNACRSCVQLNLSALSQKMLAKLEAKTTGWLQKVIEKGIPKDLFGRVYKQKIHRVRDNYNDPDWWWRSIRDLISEDILDVVDMVFPASSLSAGEIKKEAERVFRDVFGGKSVIIRSIVKKKS